MPRSGTGRIYQRGNVYWIDYSFRGKRYRESTGSTKRRDAADLLKQRMGEQSAGKVIGPRQEKVMFEDLAQGILSDYKVNKRKSIRRVRLALDHLGRTFAGTPALAITTERVRRYIVDRQEEGASDSTIQKELAALKRAFNLAVQGRMLTTKPHIPSLQVENTRTGFFSMADVERVCEIIGPDLAPVVRFAAWTGWRKGEILPLEWSQVDFTAGVVRLDPGTTKNREGRIFPFRALPPLADLLEGQRERTRTLERETGQIIPHVFHRDGKPIKSMIGAWRSATKDAGLEGWYFHDLRRTAVRNLVRAGVPEKTAMELVGHKTRSIFERYNIVNEDDLAAGVAKLAKLHQEDDEGRSVVPIQEAAQG
jgi:integrase